MTHRPESTALAQLPEAVQAMPPKMQRAWLCLANGQRLKDAAKAAGVPVGTIWNWRRTKRPFRDALAARYAELHDDAQDVLATTLRRGKDCDADERTVGHALKAVGLVQRGLGIGVVDASNVPVPANVTVNVAVGLLGGVVGSPSISQPTWDVDAVPTVAETQPSRSASSSRRPARSGSARGE